MLEKCLAWRKEFSAKSIVDEELGFKELEGVVAYMHSYDKDGHPVYYNAYGVFKDREMHERIFGDDEKLKKFLKWRVQVLERDNYPELVARKVFINVPWYFSVLYGIFSLFLTQRTKSKFVIVREGNVAETLYKYIRPENIPVQYGGLSRPGDSQDGVPKPASEFTVKGGEKVNLEIDGIEAEGKMDGCVAETLYKYIRPENNPVQYSGLSRPGDSQDGVPKPAFEFTVKGGEKVNLEIDGIEAGATITWELVVGGWELDYAAEFVPNAEKSYTIAIQKAKWMAAWQRPFTTSEFTVKGGEKVNLEIDGIEAGATITWELVVGGWELDYAAEFVNLEIDGIEVGATITWELVVGGWELDYAAEFVPNAEKSYTIAIQKAKWMAASEEPVYKSFATKEAGRMVLAIDNTNSRQRMVAAYRYIVRQPTV
ncbi:hypothetical protein IFM89_023455 [Coptis chinensis]|uniref:CRAL-TRIO domain-containing protein n=1 Tax=Coptis chinensis TaxID=261450 RepID=A0A835LK94_9MAGN|nr:hypothetical protein IFM89_023455 [Coptis chinensis]